MCFYCIMPAILVNERDDVFDVDIKIQIRCLLLLQHQSCLHVYLEKFFQEWLY